MSNLNRREFLKQGALGLVALSAPCLEPAALARPAAPKKVIVLGAGLVAASELTQAGHDAAST